MTVHGAHRDCVLPGVSSMCRRVGRRRPVPATLPDVCPPRQTPSRGGVHVGRRCRSPARPRPPVAIPGSERGRRVSATGLPRRAWCDCGEIVVIAPRRTGGTVMLAADEILPRSRCSYCSPSKRVKCHRCDGSGWRGRRLPRSGYALLGGDGFARAGAAGRGQRLPGHACHLVHRCSATTEKSAVSEIPLTPVGFEHAT